MARLLPPESAPLDVVSREIGVRADTLSRWGAEALSDPRIACGLAQRAWRQSSTRPAWIRRAAAPGAVRMAYIPQSLRAGCRAAAIQSLLATVKLNGIVPFAWLKEVLEKLLAWPNSRIDDLLPLRSCQ